MAPRRRNHLFSPDADLTLHIPVLGKPDHDRYRSFCEWQVLEVLVSLKALRDVLSDDGSLRPALAEVLGVSIPEGADAAHIQDRLRQRHQELTLAPPSFPTGTNLAQHVEALQQALGLSAIESQLLHWRCLLELHPAMGDLDQLLGSLTTLQLLHVLAVALGHPVASLQVALSAQAKLARSGLLELQTERRAEMHNKLELKASLADQLVLPAPTDRSGGVLALFRQQFAPVDNPRLTERHFSHLAPQVGLLRALLEAALSHQRKGVNILIHGEPGTGKTQLAAVLAQMLDAPLYDLALTCARGRPIRGQERLSSYRLAQALLEGSPRSLLLFDEVEDVFRPQSDPDSSDHGIKAWINQCLESNPVPAFWITNRVQGMDPAFLRRFDMVLAVGRPPLEVRRELLKEQTADLGLSEHWLEQVAQAPGWSPALLSRAVNVVQSLQGHRADEACDVQPTLATLLNGSLRAMGESALPEPVGLDETDAYLLDFANTDVALDELLEGLRKRPKARLLFHGPPGTGKSHFARHVAAHLGRRVQVERASTLLGAYVGETERNLARAFARAAEVQAVLVIDELDGLLHSRQQAVRSWEVSQVNELLLQLEKFEGLFVGTTNRMEQLDAAAMRRFDLKIAFGPLTPQQVSGLLLPLAEVVGLCVDATEQHVNERQEELAGLTMGDVQAFSNHCEFVPPKTPAALLDGLLATAPHREGARRRIGFNP